MDGNRKFKNNFVVKWYYEVNDRMSMRDSYCIRGHTALEKFCEFSNLAESPYTTTFSAIQNNIVDACNNVAFHLMISAANKIDDTRSKKYICDITV